MTKNEAIEWVADHQDDSPMTDKELTEVFRALLHRDPDEQDREQGLWSIVCQVVT